MLDTNDPAAPWIPYAPVTRNEQQCVFDSRTTSSTDLHSEMRATGFVHRFAGGNVGSNVIDAERAKLDRRCLDEQLTVRRRICK